MAQTGLLGPRDVKGEKDAKVAFPCEEAVGVMLVHHLAYVQDAASAPRQCIGGSTAAAKANAADGGKTRRLEQGPL